MAKILIVYYSLFGFTDEAAKELARQTKGDIIRLKPEKEYSFDYNTASKEVRSQIARGYCPKLLNEDIKLGGYDFVFVGSPNWFKTFAPPVLSFLRKYDFSKKAVIPFCTHGGGGLGQIEADVKKECARATIWPGIAFDGQNLKDEVAYWIDQNPVIAKAIAR